MKPFLFIVVLLAGCGAEERMSASAKKAVLDISIWANRREIPVKTSTEPGSHCECREITDTEEIKSGEENLEFVIDKSFDSTQFSEKWSTNPLRENVGALIIRQQDVVPEIIQKVFPNIHRLEIIGEIPENGLRNFKKIRHIRILHSKNIESLYPLPFTKSVETIDIRYSFHLGRIDLTPFRALKSLKMRTSGALGVFVSDTLHHLKSLELRNCYMDSTYSYRLLDLAFLPCLKKLILIHKGRARSLPRNIELIGLETLSIYGLSLNEEEKGILSRIQERLRQLSGSIAARK